MSTPSQGRSVTVTGLSGRVQALKFMQRGSAAGPSSSTPSAPSSAPSTPVKQATSGNSTPASGRESPALSPSTPAVSGSYGQEEEQWSLSPAKISQLTAKARSTAPPNIISPASPAKIEHEAGFEAWLLNRDRESARTSEPGTSTNTRQTFGSFKASAVPSATSSPTESGKKRSRDLTEEEARTEPGLDIDEDSDDNEELSLEEGSQSHGKKNGFIKPGTIHNKSRNRSSPSPSSSVKKPKSGKKKDQDRVVYTRKRGGKQGISGGRN